MALVLIIYRICILYFTTEWTFMILYFICYCKRDIHDFSVTYFNLNKCREVVQHINHLNSLGFQHYMAYIIGKHL